MKLSQDISMDAGQMASNETDVALAANIFNTKLETSLVTPAGYCIHSTVVPAIVPKYFLPPTEGIRGKELLFSIGGGCKK